MPAQGPDTEGEPGLLSSFPGRQIHPGEAAEAAAARETLEETGLTATARQVLGGLVHPATRRAAALRQRVPRWRFQPVQDYLGVSLAP